MSSILTLLQQKLVSLINTTVDKASAPPQQPIPPFIFSRSLEAPLKASIPYSLIQMKDGTFRATGTMKATFGNPPKLFASAAGSLSAAAKDNAEVDLNAIQAIALGILSDPEDNTKRGLNATTVEVDHAPVAIFPESASCSWAPFKISGSRGRG